MFPRVSGYKRRHDITEVKVEEGNKQIKAQVPCGESEFCHVVNIADLPAGAWEVCPKSSSS